MTEPIRYAIDLAQRVQHLVGVTLTMPADLADGGRLVLPAWTPGSYVIRNYAHHVQRVVAHDREGSEVALERDGVSAWRLPDGLAGPAEVRLELYANELSVRTNHVDDHHALLIGAATFPYVEGGRDRPHEVTLQPVPAGHRVFSLLPAGPTPDTWLAGDYDHLVDAAFEVGDLPSTGWEVAGVPHTFVWAGHAGRPDLDALTRDAAAIGEAAVALFGGELPTRGYTFLCIAWDQGGGGLEHRDGAVLQVPFRTFQDEAQRARFQALLAHEYLHLWNAKRLTPAALVRPDYERPTPTPSLWVAEGWTAYYDGVLPARAGVWSARRLLDSLRDAWQRLDDLPGATLQHLRQASHEAWVKHYVRDENSPNVMTDYYTHGSLVAWELDLRLRAADPYGDGLDEVLRLLWQRHGGSEPGAGDGYTEADVLDAVAHVGGDDLATLLDQRVGRPQPPAIDAEVLATVGLQAVVEDGPNAPDLGAIVTEDDRGVTIASVLRDRPAWRAGLTGGDRLVAIDGVTVARGALTAALLAHDSGDVAEVTVVRGPRLLTLPVTLGDPRPRRRLQPLEEPTDAPQAAFERWSGHPLDHLA